MTAMTAMTAVIFTIAIVLYAFMAGHQIATGHYIFGGFCFLAALFELLLVLSYIWANK